MEIGQKIKRLRIQKGLTLEELASRSELTKGFLSQLERDLTSPSIATLNDIVEALGSSLSEFFKDEKQEQLVFRKKDFFVDERAQYTGLYRTRRKTKWSQYYWNCRRAGSPLRWTRTAARSLAMYLRAVSYC